jgi:hypothetical protein
VFAGAKDFSASLRYGRNDGRWKLEKEQRNHQSAKADSFFVKEACGAGRLDSSASSE